MRIKGIALDVQSGEGGDPPEAGARGNALLREHLRDCELQPALQPIAAAAAARPRPRHQSAGVPSRRRAAAERAAAGRPGSESIKRRCQGMMHSVLLSQANDMPMWSCVSAGLRICREIELN